MTENQLPQIVASLREAKQAEEAAKLHRLAIEEQLLAMFDKPPTGEGTIKKDDFTITYKVTRTVDTDALQDAWNSLGSNAQKAFKWAASVDLKHYRAIQELDAPAFSQLASFVTTKPAKAAISLKD